MESELHRKTAQLLVEMAGDNLLTLSAEIGKMATYLRWRRGNNSGSD